MRVDLMEMMTLMSIELLNLAQTSGMDSSASTLLLAQINPVVINLLVGAFLLISIVMILIVLIQRPQGGGLGGAWRRRRWRRGTDRVWYQDGRCADGRDHRDLCAVHHLCDYSELCDAAAGSASGAADDFFAGDDRTDPA